MREKRSCVLYILVGVLYNLVKPETTTLPCVLTDVWSVLGDVETNLNIFNGESDAQTVRSSEPAKNPKSCASASLMLGCSVAQWLALLSR
jgi:hypothetical protein